MVQPQPTRERIGALSAAPAAALAVLYTALFLIPAVGWSATFRVTTVRDEGAGSLRQAILDANANPGWDRIEFALAGGGVQRLRVLSSLPALSDAVEVAGDSQPGYEGVPRVELDGSAAGAVPGLRIYGDGCSVRGLAINRFAGGGIYIRGGSGHALAGNFIGVHPEGTMAAPNAQPGLLVEDSWGNRIGGSNVISGNLAAGIYLLRGGGHVVIGNLVGTTSDGDRALGNRHNGIAIYQSCSNHIGWAGGTRRNVVSGNGESGIYIHGSNSVGNRVVGNYVGVDLVGARALGNLADGLTVASPANEIGGGEFGAGNVISGNGFAGIHLKGEAAFGNCITGNFVGVDASGSQAVGNGFSGVTLFQAHGNRLGGPVRSEGNLIAGNRQSGCLLSTNSFGNAILGNWIGVDVTGLKSLPNAHNGVTLHTAFGNQLGGGEPGEGNLISGNVFHGVELGLGSVSNVIWGNRIGTDATGLRPISNGQSGLRILSAGNQVGGVREGEGNLISGNLRHGVSLVGVAACGNEVQGNCVGLDAVGVRAMGNGGAGVLVSGAGGNGIGGGAEGAGNVISGNGDAGVQLFGATNNVVQGNRIGTDRAGSLGLGNRWEGIFASGSWSNTIGGVSRGAGNLVSGNGTRGVWFTNSCFNLMQGNRVGTAAEEDQPVPNGAHGVEFERGAQHNVLGGEGPNVVAFAPGVFAGVRVRDGSWGNAVLHNHIYGHGGMSIDLGPAGPTPDDPCDNDDGGNRLQNRPVLAGALAGHMIRVRGSLSGEPNRVYRVQVFQSPVRPADGIGEARKFLGECFTTAGPDCVGVFELQVAAVTEGGFVAATVTDAEQNTSEFSPAIPLELVPELSLSSEGSFLRIGWSEVVGGLMAFEAADLTPPIRWERCMGVSNALGTNFLLVPTQQGNRFYRLGSF